MPRSPVRVDFTLTIQAAIGLLLVLSAGIARGQADTTVYAVTNEVTFKAPHVRLAECTVKPKIIDQAEPEYPKALIGTGISGRVIISFLVNLDGTPSEIQVYKATNRKFANSALRAVTYWRFRPGQIDGKPVVAAMTYPIGFKMEKYATSPVQKADAARDSSPPLAPGEIVDGAKLSKKPFVKSTCEPVYPRSQVDRRLPGQVLLSFVVSADGTTRDIQCLEASDQAFVKPAVDAIKEWTFYPGQVNGMAVATRIQLPIEFSIVK